MPARRFYYQAKLKRKVITYAEMHENRPAGREFNVSEANVRRWRNDREKIFSCIAIRKCFSGPKNGRFPEVDEEVKNFVIETRKKALPVTRQAIQLKAREVAKSLGVERKQFKASRGWCDRFMRRSGLTLRRRTSICQKLPAEYEQALLNFQRFVIRLRKQHNYHLS